MTITVNQKAISAWMKAATGENSANGFRVEDGFFVASTKGDINGLYDAGVPTHAEVTDEDGRKVTRWASVADKYFATDGVLSQHFDGFKYRKGQLQAARMVQLAIDTGTPAVIEAGTGIGKSLAELIPALALGKRVIISTANKSLQNQLINKDIPAIQMLPGLEDVTSAVAIGKGNYVCLDKWRNDETGEVKIDDQELSDWIQAQVDNDEAGTLEDYPHRLDAEARKAIAIDDACAGQRCPLYDRCFHTQAKQRMGNADVLVTNHALLALHIQYPGAGILPDTDFFAIDEAHTFVDFVRRASGTEVSLNGIDNAIARLRNAGKNTDTSALEVSLTLLEDVLPKGEYDVPINDDATIEMGVELATALRSTAGDLWPSVMEPGTAEEVRLRGTADFVRSVAKNLEKLCLPTKEGFTRWYDAQGKAIHCVPIDVSDKIRKWIYPESGIHLTCHVCGEAIDDEYAAIDEGRFFHTECMEDDDVDVSEYAEYINVEEWREENIARKIPVIFTSATLGTPSLSKFLSETGIPAALELQAKSPFNYQDNALIYVPNGVTPCPSAQRDEHAAWLPIAIGELVSSCQGGALALFTSYANMQTAYAFLREELSKAGISVLVQGEYSPAETVRRFKQDGNAVLFATRSYWEGISIDGEALRMVILDKLPISPPSPLGDAIKETFKAKAVALGKTKVTNADYYAFIKLALGDAILTTKQGVGRLIRGENDFGVIAILDPRLHSKRYGKQVINALPDSRVTTEIDDVFTFFKGRGYEN